MKNAKELLLLYLGNIGNPDLLIDLFAEDGAVELPYLASIGGRGIGRDGKYYMTSLKVFRRHFLTSALKT